MEVSDDEKQAPLTTGDDGLWKHDTYPRLLYAVFSTLSHSIVMCLCFGAFLPLPLALRITLRTDSESALASVISLILSTLLFFE